MLAPGVQVDSTPPIKYDFLFLYAVSDLQNWDEMLLNQPVGAGDQPLVLKHTMTTGQIFLDESEGNQQQHLLVAAVAIQPKLAKALMHRFRKRERIRDEIKGHELLPAQREAFFSLMAEYTPEASAVVVCDRHHHLGGMMMGTMSAEALWGELIAEACWGPFAQRGRA